MTTQGHVTTASLKQANKGESFFICLHLKKSCSSILENSRHKLWDPKQHV